MEPVGSFQSHCEGHTHSKGSMNMDMALKGFFPFTHSLAHSRIHQMRVLSTASIWVLGEGSVSEVTLAERHAWSARWSRADMWSQVSWRLRSPRGLSRRHHVSRCEAQAVVPWDVGRK